MNTDCHGCPSRQGRMCGKYKEMINLVKVEDSILEFDPAKECENENRRINKKRA